MGAANMESIGTLAGGLAHDFNNLLYVVLGNINLAEDNLQKPVEKPMAEIPANHHGASKGKILVMAEIYPSGNWRQYSYKAMLAAEAAL